MKEARKRVISVLLLVFLCIGLGGCSGKNTNTEKKALLVVSFGTSFIESREASIDEIEKVLNNSYPNYDLVRAFTSQTIIDIYKERDDKRIYNVSEAIEDIYSKGYGEVLVIPTLVINGEEEEEMREALRPFEDRFEKMTVSTPLLTEYKDYLSLVNALAKEFPETQEKEAIVLMGHGTHHDGNSAYGALDYIFKDEGYKNVFVGTVEGFPTFETVLKNLKKDGYEKVTLMPSMIVAGDHAHNDMAGDEEDSWKNLLKSEGFEVTVIMKGLGELKEIQQLFVEHGKKALENQ